MMSGLVTMGLLTAPAAAANVSLLAIVTGNVPTALVSSGGEEYSLRVGDRIAGMRVSAIATNSVAFANGTVLGFARHRLRPAASIDVATSTGPRYESAAPPQIVVNVYPTIAAPGGFAGLASSYQTTSDFYAGRAPGYGGSGSPSKDEPTTTNPCFTVASCGITLTDGQYSSIFGSPFGNLGSIFYRPTAVTPPTSSHDMPPTHMH
jgi:hypothetical protein